MLNQPTIEKLHTMKLHGMADAFRAQLETTDASQLSFEERFAMLVDQQWLWKENRALARRLQSARLKERGVIEDIDYQHPRGLDRKLLRTLASQRMGAAESESFCSSALPESAKVGWPARWRKRLAAMAFPSCTNEPRSCSANSPLRMSTAASAGCC